MRHFTELSTRTFGIDTGFYPLGSCTMKYNPRVNERAAALGGFRDLHPHQDDEGAQGALELMWRLERMLAEVVGLDAVTLQPAAGSQGELTGLTLMRAYFDDRGEDAHARSSSPTRPTARTRPALPWPATRSWASRPTRAATSTSTTSAARWGRRPPG